MNVNTLDFNNTKSFKNNHNKISIFDKSNFVFIFLIFSFFLICVFFLFPSQEKYQLVCNHLIGEDSSMIIKNLIKMKIPYHYSFYSGDLLIPQRFLKIVNLMLLSEGLPKPRKLGFELLDNSQFGMSSFTAKINYQRALEGELEQSIQKISFIKNAKVNIAFSQSSDILKNDCISSASVILSLNHHYSYSMKNFESIKNFVASSVPNLKSKDVIILDDYGNDLTFFCKSKNINTYEKYYDDDQILKNDCFHRIQVLLETIFKSDDFRIQIFMNHGDQCNHNTLLLNSSLFNNTYRDKKNVFENIKCLLSSMLFNNNINHVFKKTRLKRCISVIILINYIKDASGQSVPLNSLKINEIKRLVSNVLDYSNCNFDNIKIINYQFIKNNYLINKNRIFRTVLFHIHNFFVFYIIIFVIFLFLLYYILKNYSIIKKKNHNESDYLKNNFDNDFHKKIKNYSSKVTKNISSSKNYKLLVKNILEIVKKNPRLVSKIIKNWINETK
ncbi:hypothetical protein [Buchnera aphidicola]|uniref:hypothetical protein n=1 Tax=Buchnera aphidicola TaxID=9 RepID=UPI0034640ED8